MKTARQIVVEMLITMEKDKAYSNVLFKKEVKPLSKQDAAFAAVLFYGVLERKLTLDYILDRYIKKKTKSLDTEVLCILRAGIYQILYMASVPQSAAVNESVKLTQCFKKSSAKGLVNAVLRSFIRDGAEYDLPADKLERMSIKYSCNKWIVELLTEQYGRELAEEYLEECLKPAPIYVRVNSIKTNADTLIKELAAEGVSAEKTDIDQDCLVIKQIGDMEKLEAFKNGLFHVQDGASQLAVKALNPACGSRLIDVCAAPGSKSLTAAEYMNNQGEIYSFDLYEHKIKLIASSAKRLSVDIIKASINDATIYNSDIPQADFVICDVPCSGLGILRRKPDIKYTQKATAEALPALQAEILKIASKYVKKGGKLLYSTCTLNKKENENVIYAFLKENNCFLPLQKESKNDTIEKTDCFCRTLLPMKDKTDGFFYAVLKRID